MVLRELDRPGVQATFLVVGSLAGAHPDHVRAVGDGGHGVELHRRRHVRHSPCIRQEVEDDTVRALEDLAAIRVHPTRWRTPWGDTAPSTAEPAADRGLTLSGPTADTHDWRAIRPSG